MTSSPPSVESADDLEATMKELVNIIEGAEEEERFSDFYDDVKSIALDLQILIAADRKAQRQTIENAQAEIYSVWSHGGNLNVLQLNHLEAAMKELSKLEAGPQPKQEREPR